MEKDSFQLATDPAEDTGHCENTTHVATETTSPPLQELHDGYDASRFNALRHGVLSVHTVLPWEDKAEYGALLNALVEEILREGKPEAYKAALAELDEQTRTSWQERLAPEPKRKRDGKYPAEASGLFTANATSLEVYLVLPQCVNQLICVENQSVFRTQVLGEALDCDKLERLGRYEVQLDRKLERMLAMLLRLQDFRRSNKMG